MLMSFSRMRQEVHTRLCQAGVKFRAFPRKSSSSGYETGFEVLVLSPAPWSHSHRENIPKLHVCVFFHVCRISLSLCNTVLHLYIDTSIHKHIQVYIQVSK